MFKNKGVNAITNVIYLYIELTTHLLYLRNYILLTANIINTEWCTIFYILTTHEEAKDLPDEFFRFLWKIQNRFSNNAISLLSNEVFNTRSAIHC